MNYFLDANLKEKIDRTIQNYLYMISINTQHKLTAFNPNHIKENIKFAFQIISKSDINKLIVTTESILEGCTRTFLINPIFDILFKHHEIDIDWRFGTTFSNFSITTREYELDAFIEFIISYNNKKIGYRYTPATISDSEPSLLFTFINNYIINNIEIPGFNKFTTVDQVIAINWSRKIEKKQDYSNTHKSIIPELSLKEFYCTYFENYDLFIELTSNAIKKAKKIIALQATTQLNRENMYSFKQEVLLNLTKEKMINRQYDFSDNSPHNTLSEYDNQIINNAFYNLGLNLSIIGKSGFAKCFITSEYLFITLKENLSIDYTTVITGYLKSIEQLLYCYYESAFDGKEKLYYWKKTTRKDNFDPSDSKHYRIDPYNKNNKQTYRQFKKTTPAIGELVYFLRYYDSSWNISETGKEFIISCLLDYCKYCRNNHFHKDNIESSAYNMVLKVRNNTIICLYYILGAFKLLDSQKSVNDQLGIIDYSFEKFYEEIRYHRFFWIKTNDGYEGYAVLENRNQYREYDEYGNIIDKELHFIKIDSLLTINDNGWYEYDEKILNSSLNDHNYLSQNTLTITNENLPEKIEIANIRRRYDRKK